MAGEDRAAADERGQAGLCADCEWMRRVRTSRASQFYRCGRSDTDPAYPRYPALPVLTCRGYAGPRQAG